MLPLRYTRRWQFAGAVVLIGVFGATVMPAVWLWPDKAVRVLFGIDKWLHGVTFALLAVWFSGQYARRSYWRIGLGLVLFGMIIELCQRMLSYRSAEFHDLAANATGIVIGLSLAVAGFGGWSVRVEEWLMRRRVQS